MYLNVYICIFSCMYVCLFLCNFVHMYDFDMCTEIAIYLHSASLSVPTMSFMFLFLNLNVFIFVYNAIQVVELLIANGAELNTQNVDGHTALMFAYNGRNQVSK